MEQQKVRTVKEKGVLLLLLRLSLLLLFVCQSGVAILQLERTSPSSCEGLLVKGRVLHFIFTILGQRTAEQERRNFKEEEKHSLRISGSQEENKKDEMMVLSVMGH